jgi:hypothetical protein
MNRNNPSYMECTNHAKTWKNALKNWNGPDEREDPRKDGKKK